MRDDILKTEYSFEFDRLRKNLMALPNHPEIEERFNKIRQDMMIVSYYKYGAMQKNYDEYKCMDALGNIRKRISKYKETRNTEFLADVANFAMIEFMYPSIKGAKHTFLSYECSVCIGKNPSVFGSIESAIDEYKRSGNTEFLADIANFALQEFAYPSLEGAKYIPTDNGACDIAGFSIKEIEKYDNR